MLCVDLFRPRDVSGGGGRFSRSKSWRGNRESDCWPHRACDSRVSRLRDVRIHGDWEGDALLKIGPEMPSYLKNGDLSLSSPQGDVTMKLLTTLLFVGLLIFAIVLLVVVIVAWPPKMGLDFTGGVRMVYEVDLDALKDGKDANLPLAAVDMWSLVQALESRINPSDTREVVVRRYGDWQVEIIVPEMDAIEMEQMKKLISTAGSLKFLIVANRDHVRHKSVIDLAEVQSKDAERQRSRYVKDADETVGYWARVGRVDPNQEAVTPGVGPLRVHVAGDVIRNATTGELIQLPATFRADEEYALERYLMEEGIREIDVLLIVNKDLALTGEHLSSVSRGYDETMRPCVRFNARGEGAALMAALTGSNLPDERRYSYQRLAIVLDGKVLTAPRIMSTISDRGQITGDFTREEVDFIVNVLQAGTLPVLLQDAPILETAYPGDDAVWQMAWLTISVTLGLLAFIWLLMPVRYGVMGLGGSMASLLQLLLMLAVVEIVQGAITLPLMCASAAILLLVVAGYVLICESVHRRSRDEQSTPRSIWRSFLRGAVPFAIALMILWFAGIAAYAVGGFAVRSVAVPVVIGTMAALATLCMCLILPVGLVASRFQMVTASTADNIPQ